MNIFILLFIALAILISIAGSTYKYGIGPTPTSPKVKTALFQHLPKLSKGPIYEIGAGWGTLAFSLADRYPNHSVIAIEVSFFPWLFMYLRAFLFPRKNLIISFSDFFEKNLEDGKLIICYLYPEAMKKLEPKLSRQLVISHTFAFPHRTPKQTIYVKDLYNTPIYIYEN